MRTILDANAILRYLLCDIPDQAEQARDAIAVGAETTVEVVAECVYVLQGVYEVPRDRIASSLLLLADVVYVDRYDELREALQRYGDTRLDFVDCVIASRARQSGQPVLTFDKKLARVIETEREARG